ncbi:3-oxoacyl-ACP reductase [Rhodovibrio sodomensis]|uniref:3-oxoacyl-ACP reductase n=1 Tax=Rhodovibrio sodomensis TaxID=1088 RepID=A0ABS1DIA8_9PROT|nr:SDR family NAD(P)-dependent oxidoreductase [Rhodovibrio sodomensis]MBK1670225.1 3-oxoacyl-ACP reductase [Rhodovibrio sodomensis]
MNKIDMNNRVAIITGGARGIGYAAAERVIDGGGRVILWDIDTDGVADAAERLGPQASGRALDLTDETAVGEATEAATRDGRVDILVNNAGITGGNAKTWELDPATWRKVVEVNLIAPYLTCRAVVPHLMANGYGRIVNVASIAGKEGNPNASHYSASKAGLIGLTKSLGKELARTGVLVNCLTPAAARTPIFDQMSQEHIDFMLSKIPMGRFVEPAEVAAMIAWLASEDCSFTTGGVFDISGGRAVY